MRNRRIRAEALEFEDYDDEDSPLDGPRAAQYASLAARLNYLAMDRPDLLFSVKELMRHMSSPTERRWAGLKRAARYLVGAPRLVADYPWGAFRPRSSCTSTPISPVASRGAGAQPVGRSSGAAV